MRIGGIPLEVSGLTRRYGPVVANDAIDLVVRSGQVVGLLGHNGAGKTTLVSQIVGLLRPDAGKITVGGVDAVAHPGLARRMVSLQPQAQAPLDGLTPRLAIELSARLRGLDARAARSAARDLGDELDIGAWMDRRALPDGRGISGGIRRLTAFAMAVAAPAPLVVLDEPTNDIDAARRRLLWDAVRRRGDAGAGILLVTHNVAEAERVVDALVILHQGRVVTAGTPADLRGADDESLCLELHLPPGAADPSTEHTGRPAILRRIHAGRRILLTVPGQAAGTAVVWAGDLRHTGRIDGFTLGPTSLEETYLAHTASVPSPLSPDEPASEPCSPAMLPHSGRDQETHHV